MSFSSNLVPADHASSSWSQGGCIYTCLSQTTWSFCIST